MPGRYLSRFLSLQSVPPIVYFSASVVYVVYF